MRIDVVRAVLRVVFQHEYRGVLPVSAVRDRVDDPAEREIVVGNHRARGPRVARGPPRVIVTDADDGELRQRSVAFELLKLLEPDVDAPLVLDAEIEWRKPRVHQPLEARHVGAHRPAGAGPRGEFAVAPDRHAGTLRKVPDVAL